jgi:hypothetical protein
MFDDFQFHSKIQDRRSVLRVLFSIGIVTPAITRAENLPSVASDQVKLRCFVNFIQF